MARFSRIDLLTVADLLRAIWELARTRWNLEAFDARNLITSGRAGSNEQSIDRIAFAIRAMGARVPWRSDCLVQALAAQHWLAAKGIGSTIHMGVKPSGAPLDAHAWLKVGDRTVLGGDVAGYSEFPLHGQR